MSFMTSRVRTIRFLSACVAAALYGCAVGPDFHSPSPPDTDRYTREPVPAETVQTPGTAGEAQRFAGGKDIPGEWWTLFQSPALDQLVRQALAHNPSLAAAQATLRQARENLNAEAGARLWPGIDANASVGRNRISSAEFGAARWPLQSSLPKAAET